MNFVLLEPWLQCETEKGNIILDFMVVAWRTRIKLQKWQTGDSSQGKLEMARVKSEWASLTTIVTSTWKKDGFLFRRKKGKIHEGEEE